MNLIDKIRERLGFPSFIKIDPNTQQLPANAVKDSRQLTGQAVVSAVLTAIYQLSRTEQGFGYLLNKDRNIPWSVTLFGEEATPVINSIASYSGADATDIKNYIEKTGDTAWEISVHELEGKVNYDTFGKHISTIRNQLLDYLPPQLNLGEKLSDNSLDDRTNKMEGPVSGMMHRIEKIFAEPQEHERFKNT
jgi:hypothetical protein